MIQFLLKSQIFLLQLRPPSDFAERLIHVSNDVVSVFYTDGEPDHAGRDATFFQFFRRIGPMTGFHRIRQGCREAGQARYEFDVLAGSDKIFCSFGTAGNVDTDHATAHGISKLGNGPVMIRRAFKARIVYFFHLGMLFQELSHFQGIFTVLADTQFQSAHAARQ